MNVLLTHAYFLCDDAKEQNIMRPYPPLGILYIAAYLERNGIANDVFDTTFSTKETFRKFLLEHTPSIVGIYVNLMTKLNVLESLAFINEYLPNTKIILGGPEVRYSAENFLKHGAHYIVIGEGEETMHHLVSTLMSGKREVAIEIPGIAYQHNGKFVQTRERSKFKDLNDLPLPARHKIDLRLYLDAWRKVHGKNAISVSTMRGCPYTCKWCSRAVYGLSYRRRSPQQVAAELAVIQRDYAPDSLWFVDDVFTISHRWLKEFHDALKEKALFIPYECITRADRLNEEAVRLLKETGCFRVWIGAESGSQKVIDLMDRRVEVEQVRNMIKLVKHHGIETGTFIMLGYPGETEADIEETIHHLKESDPDHFTITVAYPIRGTELYEEVEALQTKSLDWKNSTDRDIDFKRTYSRRFYDYAVKRVVNEVNSYKMRKKIRPITSLKLKTLALAAKAGMQWHRWWM